MQIHYPCFWRPRCWAERRSIVKACTTCKKRKPSNGFYKNPTAKDKLHYSCKECMKAYARSRDWRYAPPPLSLTKNCKGCGKEFKIPIREIRRGKGRYCSLPCSSKSAHVYSPPGTKEMKHETQREARRAVKDGRLSRPDSCESCGKSCVPQGHHDDYTKPLNVRWLCSQCHSLVHAGKL